MQCVSKYVFGSLCNATLILDHTEPVPNLAPVDIVQISINVTSPEQNTTEEVHVYEQVLIISAMSTWM